jgi:hypothetical protein
MDLAAMTTTIATGTATAMAMARGTATAMDTVVGRPGGNVTTAAARAGAAAAAAILWWRMQPRRPVCDEGNGVEERGSYSCHWGLYCQ